MNGKNKHKTEMHSNSTDIKLQSQHNTRQTISLCIQRTYFKYLNNTFIVEYGFLMGKMHEQNHSSWTQNIRKQTYEEKKLFHFPAKYLSWLQQTSYKLQKFYTTVTVHIKKTALNSVVTSFK